MRFAFEDYMLDAGRRELTHRSAQVAVEPQVFDLLYYLVRNRERVLSKDDLLQAVWGGRIVSESTLASHINAVRKAIGDNGQAQHLIRTVARKGFRFVGEVTEEAPLHNATPLKPQPANSNENSVQSSAMPDRPTIAVLPFLN